MNVDSTVDFLKYGLMTPGHHFYEEFSLEENNLKIEKGSSDSFDLKQIYTTLEESLDSLIRNESIDRLAISGGVDSRIILHYLRKNHQSFLKNKYIYCRCHPSLDLSEDRDALTVRKYSEKWDVKVNFEKNSLYPSAYLLPSDELEGLTLSGLWGGELLGGALYDIIPFDINELLKDKSSPLRNYLLKHINNSEEFFKHFLRIMFSVSYNNFSTLYNSPSWFRPKRSRLITRTPFLSSDFQDLLFRANINEVVNYKLYERLVVTYFKEDFEIPVNNPHIKTSNMVSYADYGKEPKLMPYKVTRKEKVLSDNQQILMSFIESNIDLKYSKFLKKLVHLT